MFELLGVLVSLIVVMLLVRKGISLGISLIISSLCLAIFSGISLFRIGWVTFESLTSSETITLVLTVFFIGILGELLKQTGSMDKMLDKLSALIKDYRILIAALPSLVGMLPVPGGAVLSAPMVEEAGQKLELSSSRLSGINMFFRHIWFLAFPLYPAVILILEMSTINLGTFLILHVPIMLISILISFFWLFRGARNVPEDKSFELRVFGEFIRSILPIIVAVLLAFVFNVYIPLALLVGVILAFFNYMDISGGDFLEKSKSRVSYLKSGVKFNMLFAIIGIMLYKGFVEASGVIDVMASYMVELGIPLVVMVFLVPLLAGFFMGHNLGAVGVSYPIFGPMFPEELFYSFFIILYVSSLIGYLVSPLHLCLVLTREYFEESFKNIYYELLVPLITLLLVTIVISFFWSFY